MNVQAVALASVLTMVLSVAAQAGRQAEQSGPAMDRLPPVGQWEEVRQRTLAQANDEALPFDSSTRRRARPYAALLAIVRSQFEQSAHDEKRGFPWRSWQEGVLASHLQLRWGEHIVVAAPPPHTESHVRHNFVPGLDRGYEAIADLMGLAPNDGDPIVLFWDPSGPGTFASSWVHFDAYGPSDDLETDPRIWAEWGGGLCTGFHEMGHVFTPGDWGRWYPRVSPDGNMYFEQGMAMLARQYALLRLGMWSGYREGVRRHSAAMERALQSNRPVPDAYSLVGYLLDLAWREGNRQRYSWNGLKRFFRLLQRKPLYRVFPDDTSPVMQSCYFVSLMTEAYGADLSADFGRLGFRTTEAGRRAMAALLAALPSIGSPWRNVANTFIGCRRPDTLSVDAPDGAYTVTFCAGDSWADTSIRVSDENANTLASAVIMAGEPCVREFRAEARQGVLTFTFDTMRNPRFPETEVQRLLAESGCGFHPDRHWALAGVEIEGEGVHLKLDMGPEGSRLGAGFTRVTTAGLKDGSTRVRWSRPPSLPRCRDRTVYLP